jgi:hypothetical protein
MEDYILHGHIANVKRAVEEGGMERTNTVGIEMLNLEEFKFKLKNKNGIVSMAELIDIKEFIDNLTRDISHTIYNIIHYDKKSPKYWGILNLCDDFEDRKPFYDISIDLETFMHEESEGKELVPGYFLPDNYVLAKKVLKAFEESGGDTKGIECNHYRECANWEVESKSKAKKLIKFIEDTYVSPKVKEWKEYANIKKTIWLENKVEFIYKK